jgi:hypothetical protein
MMCIACEQDFMWLAYLESRGLIEADGRPTARGLAAFADKQPSSPIEESTPEPTVENKFSCDDPTAG